MRLITIILSLFLCTTLLAAFCQTHAYRADIANDSLKKKHKASVDEMMRRHKDHYDDCTFNKRYSIKQRLSHYPYSRAAKIVAVSYAVEEPTADIIIDNPGSPEDTIPKRIIDTVFKEGLHIKNGVINFSSIKEIKVLKHSQINTLTNIVFNTDYKVNDHYNAKNESVCYYPRNSLVFFDKDGKVFDYMEICFECHEMHSKSKRVRLGTLCNQKYDLLRKFFISVGITYGTVNKIDKY